MIQAYLLYFDTKIMKIQAEVVQLSPLNLDTEIKQQLKAEGYDFHDYSDDIAILVDDQGFFQPNNPVFELKSEYGDTTQLAGRLLFVRNIETEDSVDIGSIKREDIFNLRIQLEIKLIGLTN